MNDTELTTEVSNRSEPLANLHDSLEKSSISSKYVTDSKETDKSEVVYEFGPETLGFQHDNYPILSRIPTLLRRWLFA